MTGDKGAGLVRVSYLKESYATVLYALTLSLANSICDPDADAVVMWVCMCAVCTRCQLHPCAADG